MHQSCHWFFGVNIKLLNQNFLEHKYKFKQNITCFALELSFAVQNLFGHPPVVPQLNLNILGNPFLILQIPIFSGILQSNQIWKSPEITKITLEFLLCFSSFIVSESKADLLLPEQGGCWIPDKGDWIILMIGYWIIVILLFSI